MIGIKDLDVVAWMQRPVIFDPNEIGARLCHGGASHVDCASNKTVSLFRVILEPARLICVRNSRSTSFHLQRNSFVFLKKQLEEKKKKINTRAEM